MVSLVGAGPGDPELITVKGLNRIQNADVILYDRLIHDDLIAYAPDKSEKICVGKIPHRRDSDTNEVKSWKQHEINELLIERGRVGNKVVRLKGGDPFVFGRGGEEMLALASAKISFEVIPGVSAAIAAAGSALIPVTHRGIANSFAVFTGFSSVAGEANTSSEMNVHSLTDWELAANIPSAIFMMGVRALPEIVTQLITYGRPIDFPCAVISRATFHDQQVVYGTLETIKERTQDVPAPAVLIVGNIVEVGLEALRLLQF